METLELEPSQLFPRNYKHEIRIHIINPRINQKDLVLLKMTQLRYQWLIGISKGNANWPLSPIQPSVKQISTNKRSRQLRKGYFQKVLLCARINQFCISINFLLYKFASKGVSHFTLDIIFFCFCSHKSLFKCCLHHLLLL